jgi:hypothetical protein
MRSASVMVSSLVGGDTRTQAFRLKNKALKVRALAVDVALMINVLVQNH